MRTTIWRNFIHSVPIKTDYFFSRIRSLFTNPIYKGKQYQAIESEFRKLSKDVGFSYRKTLIARLLRVSCGWNEMDRWRLGTKRSVGEIKRGWQGYVLKINPRSRSWVAVSVSRLQFIPVMSKMFHTDGVQHHCGYSRCFILGVVYYAEYINSALAAEVERDVCWLTAGRMVKQFNDTVFAGKTQGSWKESLAVCCKSFTGGGWSLIWWVYSLSNRMLSLV